MKNMKVITHTLLPKLYIH